MLTEQLFENNLWGVFKQHFLKKQIEELTGENTITTYKKADNGIEADGE